MPKSKHRKNRKPFRGKFNGGYSSDPLDLFHKIGSGTLGEHEDEAACQLLLAEMKGYDPKVMASLTTAAGLSEPPATSDDIRAIAKALTLEEPHATQS